ncbi:MAG: hypothetical protein DWP98_01540 [Bacteroidetes bacterium]|nr:MAG: hypothetical protein DWP98_01540 [Bacteroidota bacterium]MBL1145448.1 hypothetical protein [Bacteroidota bacterium]MCB0802428.1 SRPBCC family protein [Flavobacteriales bacterium]NOG58246.1 hypothetical protein [Bacteroidota bacterium]
MELSVFVIIDKPKEEVWKAIIDFKNCSNYIESIVKLEIIDEPKDTLIGFKWKETRVMFGKEATEIMWITDYADNEYYQTRAESHGSVYKSRLAVESEGEKTKLTMSFSGEAQTTFVKLISWCMGFLIKGSMKKALIKDLNDIKTYVESK